MQNSNRIKVDPAGFEKALTGMIEEYSNEVVRAMPDAVKKAAKTCVKELKSSAAAKFGGSKYKNSFKKENTNKSTTIPEITVYSTLPGLPHLLEHGHVKKNQYGVYGVTQARPHWAPAEEAAIEELENEIERQVSES